MPHESPTESDSDVVLARRAIALLDLTDLDDAASEQSVARLCERAATHGTAAVCVWPDFVAQAVAALSSEPVLVATVVNFPTGAERAFAVETLEARALADGAHEIDVVLPYAAFLAGDEAGAAAVLDAVRRTAATVTMKVILETGSLPGVEEIERAAAFAIDHGADFVKTSTGKTAVSATPDAAAAILRVITASDRQVGIKPSGGIRTVADAAMYLRLADEVMGVGWATPATFRFGASGLLDALVRAIAGDTGAASASDY
jgi:deoxyribose-phosphate aldolase